jgi:hypothetical protein
VNQLFPPTRGESPLEEIIMEVSRRSFLAGAAASGFEGFAAPVFAAPTPGLLRMPSKWDMTTDVVVAGSGIAGMCAATAAVDNHRL